MSLEQRFFQAEENLKRAETGRARLRDALNLQRATAESETAELQRQLQEAQAAATESRIEMTDEQRKRELKKLCAQLDQTLGNEQRRSVESELEAQQAMIAAAHTFHMQQQRYHEKLQAENLALHQRERAREALDIPLQQRVHELEVQLHQHEAQAKVGSVFDFFRGNVELQAAAAPPAAFKSVMEELAQQMATNASLRSELHTIKEAAALRQRAMKFQPPVLGHGDARTMSSADVAQMNPEALRKEGEQLRSASAGFENSSAKLSEVLAARKELLARTDDVRPPSVPLIHCVLLRHPLCWPSLLFHKCS